MQLRYGRLGILSAFILLASALALPACGDDTSSSGSAGSTASSSSSGTGGSGGTGGGSGGTGGGSGGAGGTMDLNMTEADFDCILKWDKVRLFRIANKLGNQAGSLDAANNPGTKDYPVGTVISLIPNEAMVKRAPGFSAASNDWEFFLLDTSATGTKIVQRGVADVANQGGKCLDCHAKAMPQFDLVCEKDHGCDALPFTDDQILMIQNGDPRCN